MWARVLGSAALLAVVGCGAGADHGTTSDDGNDGNATAEGAHKTPAVRGPIPSCGHAPGVPYPDATLTPGAPIAGVTAAQVCAAGYSASVRNVSSAEKAQVFARYGIKDVAGAYEVDHFISLELGGGNDVTNLWPEPYQAGVGAHEKDAVENYLHGQVCNGNMTLLEAQNAIASDWYAVYRYLQGLPPVCGGDAGVDTGTGGGGEDSGSGGASTGAGPTVFVIVLENHAWSKIVGNPSAPYLNDTLLKLGAHSENHWNPAGNHPSEPNYLWLEAGDNLGVTDDKDPSSNHQSTTSHLVTQLSAAGISWRSYQEGISGTSCPLKATGLYAPKHDPMVFFDDVTDGNSATSAGCIAHVRPFTELTTDLHAGTTARYNFLTPDLCHDMHGATACTGTDLVAAGDAWLATVVPELMASKAYADDGVIFITWDESEGGDFPIGMIALSPKAKPGHASTVQTTHSSTLRTVQEIFHVGPFLRGAAGATDLADLFTTLP